MTYYQRSMEQHPIKMPERIKLAEINPYLTCYLCKGYLIDATTISECLHSFCRSCIIKFLQDNSYCPICEVIINKAKPNLKLDKTLQDIVYKLVPELFLREMTRRKQYYQEYPQIAARVSPEERGEDTERTIFNPQDCISLSMEYVSADSAPGAIKLPVTRNGLDKADQLSLEESQALMKRYLQCPGMCRVDVLKKFVRNKYNVDTSQFYIDILYKRVPLPDHYTLIDIAYIYSWKRNEPMKFFFRITELNKVSERFDYFDSKNVTELLVKAPVKSRNNGAASRRKVHIMNKKNSKTNKQAQINGCDKLKSEKIEKTAKTLKDNKTGSDNSGTCAKPVECDKISEQKTDEQKLNNDKENVKVEVKEVEKESEHRADTTEENPKRFILKIKKDPEKANTLKTEDNCATFKLSVTSPAEFKDSKNHSTNSIVKSAEVSGHLKNNVQNQQKDIKNSVYTNITLNRTNNVEIITQVQKVTNKEGQSVGFNIIKQTIKPNEPKQKRKSEGERSPIKTKTKAATVQNSQSEILSKNICDKIESPTLEAKQSIQEVQPEHASIKHDDKAKFFEAIQLIATNSPETKVRDTIKEESPKRKTISPTKRESPKKTKVEKKPVTRIILQTKPKPSPISKPSAVSKPSEKLSTPGLQSLIENCKIPSSLSITLKDSTENSKPTTLLPPVNNYIEILKLPDENKSSNSDKDGNKSSKLSFSFCLNDDSEQKVDEDLAEIAKSLTEKIPMSTTISQIIGPKPDFPIPVKTNVPLKYNIQPSSVPEITNKLLNVPKDNKLNPRSPQSFQKIFEESIKKPDTTSAVPEKAVQKSLIDSTNEVSSTSSSKRNVSDIASQLHKKIKLEHEKNQIDSTTPKPLPKVAIPRLHNNKLPQQTLTNMHSNALGLNYTISVGSNVGPKTNGITSKKDVDIPIKSASVDLKPTSYSSPPELSPKPSAIPRNLSPCLGFSSPRNSPKHSPKSSPMVKHMYAPLPSLMMDQLRVNTYSPKLPSPSTYSKNVSPNLPSSSTSSQSPNSSSVSPKAPPVTSSLTISTSQVTVPSKVSPKPSSSSQSSPLSPNQLLEKYNIQNLAQLTASLNFNPANFNMNPSNQLAALQHAMLLKHFEMQNRQNWLNMSQGSAHQYENYLQHLQKLKNSQSQLLSNIKEN
ncbi:polycomb group protein Psc-like [Diabrotica virgifera virgifera]|uniref:RING-type domain-containing protein n=2 Tax=Diabrotica virgifera virgifera TaxID=50390 RepID=A0ABM5KQE8_DIAVI|nr:polycomb group protein Psc-like [Diabrotica virgifera virgifera]